MVNGPSSKKSDSSSHSDRPRALSACAKAFAITAALSAALYARPLPAGADSPARRSAVGGVLDLRDWNPARDGSVSLEGEWAFFPGRLLDASSAATTPSGYRIVPDQWEGAAAGGSGGRGAGTYRLTLLLPEGERNLALRYTTVSTAFELDAGDRTIARAGHPAMDRAGARAAYLPGVAALPAGRTRLDLTLRVSNHEYRVGGMWRAFVLGDEESLFAARNARLNRSFALSAAIAAVVLVFLFFLKNRRKDGSYFYFSMFALSTSLRVLVTGEYALVDLFPGVPFELLIRLEYLSAYSPLPLCVLFYGAIFPAEITRRIRFILLGICLPFVCLIPLAPMTILTRSIKAYYAIAIPTIVATLCLGPFRACLRKESGGIPIAMGSLVLAACAVNDILFASFIVHTDILFPVGLLAFVAAQALVLANRYTAAFADVEALSSDLSVANERLALEVNRYRESQARLETLLAEKDILLKEVHHRVKNSLQIVSSIIGLQSHGVSDPMVVAAYDAMRGRIRAISLVHEKLYGLDVSESIDLKGYVHDLGRQLAASYGRDEADGTFLADVEPVSGPADFCIDFGLILTELVSNAYRHARDNRGKSAIRVSVRREDGYLRLEVSDDGPGFPAGFDPWTARSLGYRVVSGLTRKRGGSIAISEGPKPVVRLRLAIPPREQSDRPAGADIKEKTA